MTKIGTGVVKGAVLIVTLRWTDRLIGLISTLILARLLVPADFGIIAMASLVINLAVILVDMGVHVALIQNQQPSQAHYDTAWTIRLLQTSFATLVVLLSAPMASEYFKDPRVESVLYVLAFSSMIVGLENIGVVTFQKEMQFGKDFKFVFLKRIVGFITTTTAAFLMRSYWALIIGTLAGRIFGVGLSYIMHPMRPKFTFEKFGEIFGVSQWMLVRSISGYLDENLHKMIVGRRETSTIMGIYSLADEISAMPTSELLAPLNRVIFPAFVKVKHDLPELKRKFLLAQGVQAIIGIPAGVGLALVANEAVRLLLGEKWVAAIPFIQVLALTNIANTIIQSASYVLLTLGRVRTVAFYSWIQTGLFATGALLIVPDGGASIIVNLRLLISMGGLFIFFWLVFSSIPELRYREIAFNVAPPLFSAAIMASCLIGIGYLPGLAYTTLLVLKIVVGGGVYLSTLMIIWKVNGFPDGPESYLIDKIGIVRLFKKKFPQA